MGEKIGDQSETILRHDQTRLLLTRAGFEIRKSIESRFVLRFADGSAMLRHGLVKFFLDGWRPVIGPDLEEKFFVMAEERLNKIAGGSGLEFSIPMLYLEGMRV